MGFGPENKKDIDHEKKHRVDRVANRGGSPHLPNLMLRIRSRNRF